MSLHVTHSLPDRAASEPRGNTATLQRVGSDRIGRSAHLRDRVQDEDGAHLDISTDIAATKGPIRAVVFLQRMQLSGALSLSLSLTY